MQRRASLSIIAVTATLWLGAAQAQVREIAFGIIATESSANRKTAWPLIASDRIVWRTDLDETAKQKVREFLMAYGRDAREKQILETLTFAGFVPSTNAQPLPIRQRELARERGKVERDANMAAGEKSERLQKIDGKLAELSRLLASAN